MEAARRMCWSRAGYMEHGTLWGHGAYLGPDYSAEYLQRLAEIARDTLARERYGHGYAELDPGTATSIDGAVRRLLKENRYDPGTGELRFTAAEAAAWVTQKEEWAQYFSGDTPAPGLPSFLLQTLAGGPRSLPRRVRGLLRDRPGADLPLQRAADFPPPARRLLDRHRLGGGWAVPRARRRRDLRLPDRPADRLLLRGRNRAHQQPRPRSALRRLRDAGARRVVFCLRSLAEDAAWTRAERWITVGFWGLNAGLALMMASTSSRLACSNSGTSCRTATGTRGDSPT